MSAESPEPTQPNLIDGVPGGVPAPEQSAEPASAAAELIDAVPGVSNSTLADRQGVVATEPLDNGQGVVMTQGRPVGNGETISTTNTLRTPVLGRPPGMSVEQAHVMAREQNARNAEQASK